MANNNAKSVASRSDPLIGSHLDDYEIVRLIGRGGMARVYEGYDAVLDRRAAIKVIEAELEDNEEITQRFLREARAVANLDHPNIVSVYRFGEAPGLYYLAMKLIEGRTLLSIFKKLRQIEKFLEPERIINILRQVASALDYAHSQGVIHRDIKPSNIMLTTDDRAILMDFGLLMQVNEDSSLGTAFGTPRYIAPEQALASHQAVPQSDIYSLGIILYEMVTGQVPFDSDSPMSLALSHITTPPPLPKVLRPDLPDAVQEVILKALKKAPEERWQTASAMVEALARAYQEAGGARVEYPAPVPLRDASASAAESPVDEPIVEDSALREGWSTIILPDADSKPRARPRRLRVPRLVGLAWLALGVGALAVFSLLPQIHVGQMGAAPPTAAPPRIRLIYGSDTFVVYNASGQTVSLEDISFVRPDLTSRFRVARFGERTHKALQAGHCLRILLRGSDEAALPLVCGPQTAPLILNDPGEMFWIAREAGGSSAAFFVQWRDQTLQTCSARLNTCEFAAP